MWLRARGCLPSYVHIGAVLENPANGAILAMYGGQNYKKTQYDNALQSRNQVGSSFKPYVLSTAVKQGMNVQTSQLNGFSPLWIPPDYLHDLRQPQRTPASSATTGAERRGEQPQPAGQAWSMRRRCRSTRPTPTSGTGWP